MWFKRGLSRNRGPPPAPGGEYPEGEDPGDIVPGKLKRCGPWLPWFGALYLAPGALGRDSYWTHTGSQTGAPYGPAYETYHPIFLLTCPGISYMEL